MQRIIKVNSFFKIACNKILSQNANSNLVLLSQKWKSYQELRLIIEMTKSKSDVCEIGTYSVGFLGVTSVGGPGIVSSIGNISTHI